MSYELNLAAKVPIREVRMPAARKLATLESNLRRIGEKGLPGFVIRASGLIDIGLRTPEDIAAIVIATLNANQDIGIHPDGEAIKRSLPQAKNPKLGDLHHDFVSGFPPDLRIHTTDGQGKVMLANSGTSHKADFSMQAELEIDELFFEGFVDPAIINPKVYTTMLSTGDTLIFPTAILPRNTHDITGPIWHRFDTSSDTRRAELRTIDFDNQ